MVKILPLIFIISLFIFLHLNNFSVLLSDTNIYFYTAYKLLQGQILYKDIFFTNFPLFPYISSIYFFITQGNINLFYLTSTFEVIIISILIYLITLNKTKNYLISLISVILYLFSFIVLTTSKHQTGVFIASIFAVLSFLFFEKKSFFASGVFSALMILTKAYFLPVLLSLFVYKLINSNKKEFKSVIYFIVGFLIIFSIILIPYLIMAPNDFFNDVFKYSLTRSAGVSKMNILWFFITKDLLLFVLFIFNLINIRKNLFFGLLSFFTILFFIFYKDLYYLYFNFLIPFLCLSLIDFSKYLTTKLKLQQLVIPTIISLFSIFNLITYFVSFQNLGKIENLDLINKTISKEKPQYLYGINDLTPALAFLNNVQLLNGIIDTNENIFRKGFLDKNELTKKALSQKTIIIAHGANYSYLNIKEDLLDEIFNKEEVKKSCKILNSFPIVAEGFTNRINLFKCY